MAAPAKKRVDLHSLPRFGDGWTFVYIEHRRIDRVDGALSIHDLNGTVAVPAAALSVLLLGPGVTISHAAVALAADHGMSVVWVGEGAVRFYAAGTGETTKAANLERQALAWASQTERMDVVLRLYRMRFSEPTDPSYSLQQLRGLEGVRVRDAYARAAKEHDIEWSGRDYKQSGWASADPVNRALSTANSCLYGLCHAAIVSTGFSPALGFIHTGKALSFVYDVADLYKLEVCVPIAFSAAKEGVDGLESRVRRACRDTFYKLGLIARIVPDMQVALGLTPERARLLVHGVDDERVVGIWDPTGVIEGGQNHGEKS